MIVLGCFVLNPFMLKMWPLWLINGFTLRVKAWSAEVQCDLFDVVYLLFIIGNTAFSLFYLLYVFEFALGCLCVVHEKWTRPSLNLKNRGCSIWSFSDQAASFLSMWGYNIMSRFLKACFCSLLRSGFKMGEFLLNVIEYAIYEEF